MPSPSLSPAGRGMVFGLIGGLFFGGVFLLAVGARALFLGPDCTNLTPEECGLEREIALTMGRQQVMFGSALALLGIALYLYYRSRLSAKKEETP